MLFMIYITEVHDDRRVSLATDNFVNDYSVSHLNYNFQCDHFAAFRRIGFRKLNLLPFNTFLV